MYLKNLTSLGFKSFADKTVLNFLPGITAIVGPNGCGKSNVADAIRWVLGEQSAKALRGSEMADVIFNGADSRKPMGMAEVSVTIGDVDQEHLKAAGIELSFNEVTVTRRVFRDGVSEYLINKAPCRLKDVQQLFMGTGMGRASYSIMAQGHITQLLSSRPDDRRMVFEEAAGITRFKVQKKEALRKLESTEQNLLRISDLIREVKRQIGSLQRQAGKARRYKQIYTDLQHLETQLMRHQYDVLQTEITDRNVAADKLRIEIEVCSESVLRQEDQINQLRARQAELEQMILTVQQEGLELKNRMEQCENRIHFNEERLQELEQRNARALGDIAQGEERKLVAEQELTVLLEKIEASTLNLERLRLEMKSKREAMDEVERSLRLLQEQLRQAQSVQFGVTQQLNRVRNQITAMDLQKQANASRVEKLSAEKIQLEEERLRLEGRFKEFVSTVEAEKVSAQVRRGTLEQQQQRLRVVQSDLTRVTKELDELLRQQAGCRSRLNVLEQLQASHEGFSAGALAALQQAPQLLGALVDRIRVPQEHILAIESALGHHLQLLLTQEPENALKILTDLKTVKKGRASISPLALYSQRVSTTASPFENESVSSSNVLPEGTLSALQAITSEALVHPLLESLLGNTLIVDDLEVATRIWKDTKGSYDFVTRQGELLSRHGIYTGGAANGNDKGPASILGRKLQIEELQVQLAKIQDQVNESSRSKGALQSEQSSLQANLQQEQAELRTQEVAIATHQGECKALENSVRLLHQKIDTVVYEIESLADQEHQSLQKREEFAAQAASLEAQERDLQEKISEGNANLESLRSERDAANNSLTETKVAFASGEQLNSSYRQQEKSLDQRIRELSHMVEQRRLEVNSLIERRTQFQEEIQSLQQKIESLHHQREQVNARNAELLSQKQALEREILEKDDHLRDHRRRLTEIQQHRSALEVELAQKGMAAQNLCERTMQKYQVKLQDVKSECLTITMAEEGPAKVEILSSEEMANRGLSTNWNEVGEQVQAMQRRIDEMGPVNLVAIEEYEETEQRFQFLSTQHDDLVKAKEQLLEVITRINTQTREMFSETFNKIRENFSILFTEIFGGGKADLMLVDADDVLESGIEILARPPGKQLKSITLLSGGEQTMTAVALLFAIYQVKPSPFCVLDELDAPLDESNINRFIGVLKRFLNHSQFIIITHNKRTIATADVIYGVTMQEHGVSKIVSMRFHKATGGLTDSPAAGTTAQVSPSASTPSATENISRLPGNGASLAADKAEVKPSVPMPSIGDSVEFVSAK